MKDIQQPPRAPKEISEKTKEELSPLPKCKHGHINSLCIICNKELYD